VAITTKCQETCRNLVQQLPADRRSSYLMLFEDDQVTYVDDLHQGLTLLARSCMDLATLFSKLKEGAWTFNQNVIVEGMVVGYLFEVYPGGHPNSPTCGHLKIPHPTQPC
jgi:hypothetical protein